MAQLSLFAEDIRQSARPLRSDIRTGDAAESSRNYSRQGSMLMVPAAMRLMTLALI
jgi:hypothetical protein